MDSNDQAQGTGGTAGGGAARTDLVAIVAQEMRTPLTVVKGYTQRLLMSWETLDDHGKQAMLGRINTSISRLQRLVEDIMLVSGGLSGEFVMMARPYLLEPVVQHAILEVGVRRGDRATMIVPAGENVSMYGDQYRMEQALITLLELAVVRSPRDTLIDIAYGERDGILRVAVTDRGPAVTPEVWTALFGRSGTPASGGALSSAALGLDLFITDRLISVMGGTLEGSSTDEATQVVLELPISRS